MRPVFLVMIGFLACPVTAMAESGTAPLQRFIQSDYTAPNDAATRTQQGLSNEQTRIQRAADRAEEAEIMNQINNEIEDDFKDSPLKQELLNSRAKAPSGR